MPDGLLTTLLILSTPHIFYYYVWTQSATFMKYCKKYFGKKCPVEVFSQIAYVLKMIQFLALFIYIWSLGSFEFSQMTAVRALTAIALIATGQILNSAVYKAIGVNGVYYGCRLGKKIDRYEGFPFNSVPHPQYLGSALSYWGIFLIFYNAPHHASLMVLGVATSIYYVASSYIEQTM